MYAVRFWRLFYYSGVRFAVQCSGFTGYFGSVDLEDCAIEENPKSGSALF